MQDNYWKYVRQTKTMWYLKSICIPSIKQGQGRLDFKLKRTKNQTQKTILKRMSKRDKNWGNKSLLKNWLLARQKPKQKLQLYQPRKNSNKTKFIQKLWDRKLQIIQRMPQINLVKRGLKCRSLAITTTSGVSTQ